MHISFLNALLKREQEIKNVSYLNSEVFEANDVAHELKQMGLDIYQITQATGLSIEEIKQL